MMLADALARQGNHEAATAGFSFLLAYGSRQDVRERAREGLARVAQLRMLALAAARAKALSAAAGPAVTAPESPAAPPSESAAAPSSGSAAAPPPASAAAPPSDQRRASSRFRPDLREVGTGEQRVLGVFRSIQCQQGTVVLEVQTATALMRFAAGQLSDVDFISYRTDTPRSVNCGAVAGAPPVLATYRPSAGGTSADGTDGAIVAIELIPDGYVPR
jgi:hypothetical protein